MQRYDDQFQRRLTRRATIAHAVVALVLVTLAIGGCAPLSEWAANGGKTGPNYQLPESDAASNWIDYHDPRMTAAEQDLTYWWPVFDDPVLDLLVEDSYRQNLTLRVAGERIAESRARRGIAVGNLFPQQQELAG